MLGKLYKFLIGRSLRLRLTLIYSVGVTLALFVLSFTVYRSIVNNLYRESDHDLEQRSSEVVRFFASVKNNTLTKEDLDKFVSTFGSNGQPMPSGLDKKAGADFLLSRNDLASSQVYLQVLNTDGTLLQAIPDIQLMKTPENQQLLAGLRSKSPHFETVILPQDNERVRVHTVPLMVRGQTIAYIQSIDSLQEIDTITASLIWPLALGTVLTAAFLAVLVWLVTLRTLSPLERITDAAYRIGINNNMGERIAVDARFDDEVTRMGKAFNAMLERLDKSFETQRQFVADSSHELRTPLTVIRGNLDLLKRNPDPQNQIDSLQAIERETGRMKRLVEDLLLLAQNDNTHRVAKVKHEQVQLDSLIFDIYKDTRVLADAKGHNFKLTHFEPAEVEGDADQLKRAILNLVENAIKYTPDGGTITLALYRGKKFARVLISDNGLGIAPEDQARIFDRFFRVDKARSRSSGGTGLGLAIVKVIVEAHGGRIQVESKLGKGSTFTIWLQLEAGFAETNNLGLDLDEEYNDTNAVEEDTPKAV